MWGERSTENRSIIIENIPRAYDDDYMTPTSADDACLNEYDGQNCIAAIENKNNKKTVAEWRAARGAIRSKSMGYFMTLRLSTSVA